MADVRRAASVRITRLDHTDTGTLAVGETDDGRTMVGFDPSPNWQGYDLPRVTTLHRHGFTDLSVVRIVMGWTHHQAAAWASREARRAVLRRGCH